MENSNHYPNSVARKGSREYHELQANLAHQLHLQNVREDGKYKTNVVFTR